MASFWKFGCGRLALLAAMGVFAGASAPAQAADLGGDCCADLEERIAELEATTARKGNRKVKLEVSGHVNEAVLWWDDGSESNVGVYTNDSSRTRFRFKGEARFEEGWKAGYLLEIGVRSANSKRFDQNNDNAGAADNGLDIRHSVWYVDSVKYGRLWVGLTGGAGESVTEVNQAATKDIAKYADIEDNGLGLFMVTNGVSSGTSWRRLLRDGGDQPGEGRRYNMVRYDTPEMKGFIGTANWGEDDGWEIGLRYKGDIGPFAVAAAVAYGESTDTNGAVIDGAFVSGAVPFQCPGNEVSGAVISTTAKMDGCQQVGGSVSVMHLETGIYANLAGGWFEDDNIKNDPGLSVAAVERPALIDDTHNFIAAEVGIEKKWNELGKTTLFVQYYKMEGGTLDRSFTGGLGAGDILGSELEAVGGGVVQGVDNAAMHVYLMYRHLEGEITRRSAANTTVNFDVDDLDIVMGGAIIRF